MTLFFHELKRGRISLIIWTVAIAFMLGVCIVIYPEMSSQMGEISEMFANMGSFSAAFGMDELNFGEFIGYFGVECGNVLGLGGAFFAAILGVSALAKEEKERTAELLLSHPISRARIITEKLLAVLTQILILNLVVAAVVAVAILAIGEKPDASVIALLLLAYFLLQIEIAAITFGISAFISSGGLGIGLGVAVGLYFLNIIANLTEELEFLKWITPFGYTEGGDIVAEKALNGGYLAVGALLSAVGIALAYVKYTKKDIA